MGATPAPNPQPSREQLQMAFRHYADPHWPATLDEALHRPAYSKLLMTLARRLSRPTWGSVKQQVHTLPTGPVPPTPTQNELQPASWRAIGSLATGPGRGLSAWPKSPNKRKPGAHDCKRAAANDKDD